jgi:hypothetical protein
MCRQLIGSLMYMIHTRPNICYVVIAVSQFMTEPRHKHWVATKHILRYLRGTITYGLRYTSSGGLFLHGYADDDWAGSLVDWSVKFGSIDSHSPMRGHMGHPEASQGDLENQPVL